MTQNSNNFLKLFLPSHCFETPLPPPRPRFISPPSMFMALGDILVPETLPLVPLPMSDLTLALCPTEKQH